jgi:hypothetical protein
MVGSNVHIATPAGVLSRLHGQVELEPPIDIGYDKGTPTVSCLHSHPRC